MVAELRRHERSNHASKQLVKLEERKKMMQAALDTIKSVRGANEEITPLHYILYLEKHWTESINGDNIFRGHPQPDRSLQHKNLDAVTHRGIHLSCLHPDRLQTLPGQDHNYAIGPNIVLSEETLEMIPHCTNGRAANQDKNAWIGMLGWYKTCCFWLGHHNQYYKAGNGQKYYGYLFQSCDNQGQASDTLANVSQFRYLNAVNPVHAGLGRFSCNSLRLKNGPFANYDLCFSFVMREDMNPLNCEFILLRVRDAFGTMHEVNINLRDKDDCIKATPRGIVYTPPL